MYSGFNILENIHESHKCKVFKAERISDNSPVILKVRMIKTDSIRTLINNEYEIGKVLNEKYVVPPIDLVLDGNDSILVFKDDNMESVKNVIPDNGFELKKFLKLAVEIASAIDSIHYQKIIHKDINPTNIIFDTTTDKVKLIDFGLATRMNNEAVGIMAPGVLLGTLGYISPEQTGRVNRLVDNRTDLYSVGITFYQMLAGRLPFENNDSMSLVHSHIAKTARSLHKINKNVPIVISNIVEMLMAKNAEDRYQSASSLKIDLEKCKQIFNEKGNIPNFNLAENDYSGDLVIPQKLYGRKNETDTILKVFDKASHGKSELLIIAGYSGVGKTALVKEVYKPMTECNGHYISGKFNQYQKNIPYFAITQAFNRFVQYLFSESKETVKIWKKRILNSTGDNAQVIIDVIPDLEHLTGKQPYAPILGAIETQNRFLFFFKKFINSICSKEHPLVLFIDDLQWADSASLSLIKEIMLDDGINNLLIIGAYRDNEVDKKHLLTRTIDGIINSGANVTSLVVKNLLEKDINELISESLNSKKNETLLLTKLIYQKTEGNAFFTHQFIHSLYDKKLLVFDLEIKKWKWKIENIKRENITDNVVEMMTERLEKLPTDTISILNLAACIGGQFTINTLNIISNNDKDKTTELLKPALIEGAIKIDSSDYTALRDFCEVKYGFLHDRIRQSAYTMIDKNDRVKIHLKIARLLYKNKTSEYLHKGNIFSIAEHFSKCINLLRDKNEKKNICKLYIEAGKKAKMSTAYQTALRYCKNAEALLLKNSWNDEYELSLSVFTMLVELSYLTGNFEQMDKYSDIVSENSQKKEDESKICNFKIQSYVSQNKLDDAIREGLDYLKEIGIEISETITFDDIGKGLGDLGSMLKDVNIDSLYELDVMSDEKMKIAMSIIVAITPAAYQANPTLMIILILKQVELSVKYGNVPESSYSYAAYGFILCGVVGDIDTGYKFGQLGLGIVEKFGSTGIIARTILIYNYLVIIWKKSLRGTTDPFLENYQRGLEIGDLEFASYSIYCYFYHAFSQGESLKVLSSEIDEYIPLVSKLKHEGVNNWMSIFKNAFCMLGSSSGYKKLQESEKEEEHRINKYKHANDRTAICHSYLTKSILNYMWYDYEIALKYINLSSEYIDSLTSSVAMAIFNFYNSLIRLALYKESSDDLKKEIMEKIFTNQKQLKIWADHSPLNFKHKYNLIEAEKANAEGRMDAVFLYEQAINGAKESRYIQEEAMVNELAAKFYFDRKMEKVADVYIDEAYLLYRKWGAKAKADQLKTVYKNIQKKVSIPTIDSSSIQIDSHLDIESISKASQAISKEVKLEQLLKTLISIVVENVGAEKGVMLIKENGEYKVQASKTEKLDKVETMQNKLLEKSTEVPISLINDVIKSEEVSVLKNISKDMTYKNDIYVVGNQPKSVICMPVIHQGETIGVIYLENNLLENLFDTYRVKVLKILISQAAIAIDNANLFNVLEKNKDELKKTRNYIRNIIDSMPSILVGVDSSGDITHWNLKAEHELGILSETALGKPITKVFPRIGKEMDKITDAINTKKEIHDNKRMLRHNGESHFENLTVFPLIANGVQGAVIRIDDVTKEYKLEEQLLQSSKMDAVGQLAGGIAHDFNNMLAGIIGSAQLLQSPRMNLNKKAKKFVNLIIDAVVRSGDLTSKLLSFSRKGQSLTMPIDINKIIDNTIAIFDKTIDKKIKIKVKRLAENTIIIGNDTSIQNCLMNLGINASHAMENGGELNINTKNIELSKVYCDASSFDIDPGKYIEIEIRDSGIGIPLENIKKVFEPFFTTKAKAKGTGLGLSAVFGTIQEHSGVIDVYSEVGVGTVFHIYLPCSNNEIKDYEIEKKVISGSGKILLVDDEELLRVTGGSILNDMGYEVMLAKNGLEAVNAFKENKDQIDVVIMDMVMPEMNGSEAFFKIKEIDKNAKIIIASGFTKAESLKELNDAGLKGFLNKPYRDYELSVLLNKIMK